VSTAMRLKRTGSTKRPCYRIVVIDSRNANTGDIIDSIGTANPRENKAAQWVLNEEKAIAWIKQGVQPSESVRSILSKAGIWAKAKAKTPVAA
jgi:small subunit ribosomal protein S16